MNKNKIKIVVLSLDPSIRLFFRKFVIQSEDLEVFTASRGDTGLRLIRDQHPSIIFMSPFLVGMGGIRLCEELRKSENFMNILIIGVLRRKKEKLLGRVSQAGFDAFITFPLQKEDLENLLSLSIHLSLNTPIKPQPVSYK
ncbi:MAG: response regulator [Promethearchaeia archaeon]